MIYLLALSLLIAIHGPAESQCDKPRDPDAGLIVDLPKTHNQFKNTEPRTHEQFRRDVQCAKPDKLPEVVK